jgi:hypothetical protein
MPAIARRLHHRRRSVWRRLHGSPSLGAADEDRKVAFMTITRGILAVWNDCRPGSEDVYEAWYRDEHLQERVSLPGFIGARRYVSLIGASPKYFTCYLTETPDVLTSAAYRARGADPTPMTRQIMAGPFQNMTRALCRRERSDGASEGAIAVTIRAKGTAQSLIELLWPAACALPQRLRAETWASIEDATHALSIEEKIRGKDDKIDACILVSFSEADHAEAALAILNEQFGVKAAGGIKIGIYQLLCTLYRRDLEA